MSTGLKEPDKKFYSFIKDEETYICIEWEDKPFTLYLKDENPNILEVENIYYCETKINLKYTCSIKENYAQRIANHSFKQTNRVGISFVKKKSE